MDDGSGEGWTKKTKPIKKKKTKVRAVPGNCPDRQTDTVTLIYKIQHYLKYIQKKI